jgi:hypothetical protein
LKEWGKMKLCNPCLELDRARQTQKKKPKGIVITLRPSSQEPAFDRNGFDSFIKSAKKAQKHRL